MATDLMLLVPDQPGSLAGILEALGNAGVNIDGMFGYPVEVGAVDHILVEDAAGARRALEGAGFQVSGERAMLVVDVPDRPGEIAKLARRMAYAGVNIQLIYEATHSRIAFGADDLEKARAALE